MCGCVTVLAQRSVCDNLLAMTGLCTTAASFPDVSVIRSVKRMPDNQGPNAQGHSIFLMSVFLPKYKLAAIARVIIKHAKTLIQLFEGTRSLVRAVSRLAVILSLLLLKDIGHCPH